MRPDLRDRGACGRPFFGSSDSGLSCRAELLPRIELLRQKKAEFVPGDGQAAESGGVIRAGPFLFKAFDSARDAFRERARLFLGISQFLQQSAHQSGSASGKSDARQGCLRTDSATLHRLEQDAFECLAIAGSVRVNPAEIPIKSRAGLREPRDCGFCGLGWISGLVPGRAESAGHVRLFSRA